MCNTTTYTIIWLLLIVLTTAEPQRDSLRLKLRHAIRICPDNRDIEVIYAILEESKDITYYTLDITKEIQPGSLMILRFDSETSLNLIEPTNARISKFPGPSQRSNRFVVTFTGKTFRLRIQVFVSDYGNNIVIPYLLSIILNDVEICTRPKIGYFDLDETIHIDAELFESSIQESCGTRKVVHTELIVRGQPTKPGDWPWHAAIIMYNGLSFSYICGGTLLSKTSVLTAAHCVTLRGNPVAAISLSIVLGKYHYNEDDIGRQERSVLQVIVHPAFDAQTTNNDIALLKLKSEAVFTNYVQPACLWHTALPSHTLVGTVVGWGLNHHAKPSLTLQQTTVPIIKQLACASSDPFFQRTLNMNKFCGGFANGTTVCHGDSGGGLMIFVPHTADRTGKPSGAWYVRGIVSFTASTDSNVTTTCDPYKYAIFTDVYKYLDWVIENK